MNTTTKTSSRWDGFVAAIGLIILLIGTSTGNSMAMLIASLVALAMISAAYRNSIGRKAFLIFVAAASIGCATVMTLTQL